MFTASVDEEQIIARVAALDVDKAEVVCCVRLPGAGGREALGPGGIHALDDDAVVDRVGGAVGRVGDRAGRDEKLLEDACIKLSLVATDIFGVSGRAMMAALIAGEHDPKVLADMARTKLRTKLPALEEAFTGRFDDHHAFLLERMLARVEGIDADIDAVDRQVERHLAPFAHQIAQFDEIPSPASGLSPRPRSSPRLASTCPDSRPPDTSARGRG